MQLTTHATTNIPRPREAVFDFSTACTRPDGKEGTGRSREFCPQGFYPGVLHTPDDDGLGLYFFSPGARSTTTRRGHTVFAFVIGGRGRFDTANGAPIGDRHLVFFDDGDSVHVAATAAEPVRFLLVSGRPIGEPIAWQGPIVINTEELRLAFYELVEDPALGAQAPPEVGRDPLVIGVGDAQRVRRKPRMRLRSACLLLPCRHGVGISTTHAPA